MSGTESNVASETLPPVENTTVESTTASTASPDSDSLQQKRKDLNIPEGMSKKQWKKQQKKLRWEESKEEFKLQRREKKKLQRLQRKKYIKELIENGEELPKKEKIYKKEEQKPPIAKILIDCEFDDLMSDKEVLSLSSQITRSYAANRRTLQPVELEISSFNKRLRQRFDSDLPQYHQWGDNNIKFHEENVEQLVQKEGNSDMSNFVYLTADTEEKLETLKPGMTYILGGIVDKGRYKNLCLDKAVKLGIPVKRLPIDEFIQLSGRRVLATSHVFELLVKWFELQDWKELFEAVLPERKLVKPTKDGQEEQLPELEIQSEQEKETN